MYSQNEAYSFLPSRMRRGIVRLCVNNQSVSITSDAMGFKVTLTYTTFAYPCLGEVLFLI